MANTNRSLPPNWSTPEVTCGLRNPLQFFGMRSLEDLGHFVYFALRALIALPAALTRPRELIAQLYAIFLGALPLGMVAGLALGVVVWIHLRGTLQAVGGP